MKILTIGSDRKLFEEGSDVQNRIIEYGTLFDELHIIVFTTRYQKHGVRFKNTKVGDNVWIYPTYSRNKFFYIVDAVHIGKRIFRTMHFRQGHDCISTQDPFEAGLAGWFLKRASHISLQLQIHTDFFSPYFGRESVLNRIRVRIATFLIPRADGIRVVSKRIKESLESRIPPSTPLRQGYAGRARLWRASKN
ncbi:MAG: glycosyltransferase [bacterium]|nr:glycosyltransferase [bacterium]